MASSPSAETSNTRPLVRRAASLVVSQRLEDGRAIGHAGDLLRKVSRSEGDRESAVSDEMTVTNGMDIRNANMVNVDVAVCVTGGHLGGVIRTTQAIRVMGGTLSGYIETDGDVIISGGTVDGIIVAGRIAIRGNAKVSGICVSDALTFRDNVSVKLDMMSQAAATTEWRRERMLEKQVV